MWKFAAAATVASRYKMQAILLGAAAGLSATAYSYLGGGFLSNFLVSSSGDFRQGLLLSSASQFYALYSGYFLATQPGMYTFQVWKKSPINETLRMIVGDLARIDFVNGTNCSTYSLGYCVLTATCFLESPGNLYSVNFEYSRNDLSMDGGNFSLNFQIKNSSFSSMMPYIFPPIGARPDAADILVAPSSAKAAASIASGNCLTLATAGTACQFSISARDEFGSASTFPSNVSILCSSLIDFSFVSGNVIGVNGSIMRASYVPSLAGYHILSVFFKYSTLQWTLVVSPAPLASAYESVVQGTALSLATAGALSKFSMFAMDKYGNLLERVGNIAIIVENEASSEYHAVSVVSNRAINTMVFKDLTATYRVTTSGRYRITVATLDPGLSMCVYSESSSRDASVPAAYLTTSDDVNLLSYYALGPNLFLKSNVTFSQISFSGFISLTTSGVITFKVLTGSTADVVSLNIDRIKLIDSNATNDAISNGYLLTSLDSRTLDDAVIKVNWPDSSSWVNNGNQSVVDSTTNSVRFPGGTYLDAGSKTWNIHTSGFGITAAFMVKSMTVNQKLIHFFNAGSTNNRSIILEFVKSGGSWDIRFLIYNEINDEVNSGCITSASDQPLRAFNTKYVITATYDVAAKVSKIYVDGLLRKQCSQGANAAVGPRALQFSYIGRFWPWPSLECQDVTIGSGGGGVKVVALDRKFVCPVSVSKANWLGSDSYGDTFNIQPDKDTIVVTRTDAVGSGWGMNLRVKCCSSDADFIGKLYALAVFDRPLNYQEVMYQHHALKGLVPVATIALVASTLYEFQLNYSAINFSRVGLMVCFFPNICGVISCNDCVGI